MLGNLKQKIKNLKRKSNLFIPDYKNTNKSQIDFRENQVLLKQEGNTLKYLNVHMMNAPKITNQVLPSIFISKPSTMEEAFDKDKPMQ